MKSKTWGAIAMVAFAWVLWEKQISVLSERWEFLDGYESRFSCHEARTRRIEILTKKLRKPYKLDELKKPMFSLKRKIGPDRSTRITLFCLPEKFEPRPKK